MLSAVRCIGGRRNRSRDFPTFGRSKRPVLASQHEDRGMVYLIGRVQGEEAIG